MKIDIVKKLLAMNGSIKTQKINNLKFKYYAIIL